MAVVGDDVPARLEIRERPVVENSEVVVWRGLGSHPIPDPST
jgi:hypothetical protein